ncbi:MAG: MJ0042-type zinc finger domain-containing protein [Gemmataceae bacterium]
MPEQVRCPSCEAALRVPDNLLGKNVKCPKCQTTFVAEMEEQSPPEGIVRQPKSGVRRPMPPEETEEEDELPPEEDEDRPRRRRRRGRRRSAEAESAVAGPAISLMVMSGIAVALSIFSLIYNLFMGGLSASLLSRQNSALQQQMPAPGPGPRGVGMQPVQSPTTPPPPPLSPTAILIIQLFAGIVGNIIGLAYWSVVFAGAMKMKSLSSYGFAMTSSIMSMLPCSCCCIVGLPIGIWSLVVLNRPEVKDAFS